MFFSVIVPIYKVEKYLNKCIDSILNQSFEEFELLLVDDGSPDNCPKICDEYAKKDKRIRVIHKENGGLVSARNEGIKNAKGDYICYVDGDDWVHADLLKRIYEKAIVHYQPDMVIFGIAKKFSDYDEEILCDLSDGIYEKQSLTKNVYPYMMYDSRKPFCKGLIFPAACNKIYRRELLLRHLCEDERIRMGEDNAFVYECVWYSNKIYVCNEILYFYNQLNPGAMNQSYDPNRFTNNKYLFDYMEKRITGISDILDGQFNAFKAYWLTMAVFHEIKSGIPIRMATKHVKQGIKENDTMNYINMRGLPKTAKIFVFMLKMKLYYLTMFIAKIVQSKRR